MTEFSNPTLVISMEGDLTFAGFAGDKTPTVKFPTVLTKPRDRRQVNADYISIGDKALVDRVQRNFQLHYPINVHFIDDLDDFEKILHHTFYNQLRAMPEEHPVLLNEFPAYPTAVRENILQLMFETFRVPVFYLGQSNELALYATGKTTGLVIHSDRNFTCIAPIYKGHQLHQATTIMFMGTEDSMNYLLYLLTERGYDLESSLGRRNLTPFLQDIQYKLGYVALDFQAEFNKDPNSLVEPYELPDGSLIPVATERFQLTEVLFQPTLRSPEQKGIVQEIVEAIAKTEPAIQKELYANIVLSGPGTIYPGFAERLHKDLSPFAPPSTSINITTHPQREFLTWLGGSLLASQPTFGAMSISREQYDESGPSIVRKIFPKSTS